MGEVTLTLPAAAHDALRRAALTQTAATLRHAASNLDELAARANLDEHPATADALSGIRLAREDLDALAALGIGEPR